VWSFKDPLKPPEQVIEEPYIKPDSARVAGYLQGYAQHKTAFAEFCGFFEVIYNSSR
jgi:hypothetical protein